MSENSLIERRVSWNAGLRASFRRLEHRWKRPHFPAGVEDRSADGRSIGDRDEWMRFGISIEERCLVEQQHPNVLVIGSGPSVDRFVHLLERTCLLPIVHCGASPLMLPTSDVGTLTVSNAERLNAMDQQLLFAWLTCVAPRRQVITTAAVPLFPAVIRSTFSEALFYRLNSMCLVLRDTAVQPGVPGQQ